MRGVEDMKPWTFLWIAIAFLAGWWLSARVERASFHVAENKEMLTYEGAVYVRAIEGTSLEDYLTAAGRPKPKGKK